MRLRSSDRTLLFSEEARELRRRRSSVRQAFDDGRLTYAGFADEDRVVLGAAAKDLDDSLYLEVAANEWVQGAVRSCLRKIAGELSEHGLLLLLTALLATGRGAA